MASNSAINDDFTNVDVFYGWPSINSLHRVRMAIKSPEEAHLVPEAEDNVTYNGKVKLHGSNTGVEFTLLEGEVNIRAMSRTKYISPSDDFCGFAQWVEANKGIFEPIKSLLVSECVRIIVYGEWCGPRVQRGVAVSEVGCNIYAIFAIATPHGIVVDPAEIARILPLPKREPNDVFIIPFAAELGLRDNYSLNLHAPSEALESVTDAMSADVLAIEKEDPLIKSLFNVSGIGEGLVFYPTSRLVPHPVEHLAHVRVMNWRDFPLMFKAKGAEHAVVAQKKPVAPAPQASSNILEFAKMCAPPARCEQGLKEVTGSVTIDKASMGKVMSKFLQWVVTDVQKECQAELAASGLTWNKEVSKAIETVARNWLIGVATVPK